MVLEVQSQNVCQTGFEEEAELHWKDDVKRAMEPCSSLKHTFARTARECKDVVFLSLEVGGQDAGVGRSVCCLIWPRPAGWLEWGPCNQLGA